MRGEDRDVQRDAQARRGPLLRDPRQVTAFNAFHSAYAWGKSELVNFTSAAERPLQAALYYPANYDPARKYPMIVYVYEKVSDGLHRYVAPSEREYYNVTAFTSTASTPGLRPPMIVSSSCSSTTRGLSFDHDAPSSPSKPSHQAPSRAMGKP